MIQKRNNARWAQWRERLQRQRASGLSITEFCRKEGICRVSFQTWKRKLREGTSGRGATGRRGKGPATSRRDDVGCGHVKARRRPTGPTAISEPADFFQVPVLAARSSPWIELSLADGAIVRIPQGNLAALATLLRVLRGGTAALAGEADHA
jgi:hypothetical protein